MIIPLIMLAVVWQWIITVVIIAALAIIFFFERQLIKKHEESLSKVVLILIYLASFILLIAGIFSIMLVWDFDIVGYFADIGEDFTDYLSHSLGSIIGTIVVIFLSLFILKIAKVSFKRIGKKPGPMQRRKKTIGKILGSITKYLIGILAVLIILAIWGVNIVPALAGLGIAGLVIGLGAQKFINDLISGFFIVFEHHFDVGDRIEVAGFKGEVIDIGLKTTKIKNWKNEIKILSNGEISNLTNFSKDTSLAVVEFGVAYKENIQNVIDVLNRELPKIRDKMEQIIENPTVAGVTDLANSSVNIRVTAKTLNEQHYGVERELRKFIKEILDKNKIEIPFPQVVVHQPKN
jgi:moderate conductance mechanosensitive channel